MKLGIINSAFDQAGVDTVSGLEQIARIGFDCVDLFTEAMTLGEEETRVLETTCSRLGLPVVSLPVVACGLVDFNAPVRDFHVRRVRAFSELAHRLRARNLLLVLGEYIWQREVIPPEAQWKWGVETVREIGLHAAELGLEVALELEPFRLSLLNDVRKMARFIDDVALPMWGRTLTSVTSCWRMCPRRSWACCGARPFTCTSAIAMERCMAICLRGAAWSSLLPISKRFGTSTSTAWSRSSWSILRTRPGSWSGWRKLTRPRRG